MEDEKEEKNEAYMEDEKEEKNEALGTVAGIAGIIAAAGGLTKLEMAANDPEFQAKYPRVAKALEMMQKVGADAAASKRMEEEATAKELEETKEALEAVKAELNEVNLLNSKLLYVNRIFKANNLNEAQKLRVVETLDNASNVKEAKLIYETIKDTFNVAKTTKTTPKRSIKEGLGMASKAAGTSTAPKKPVLNESNDMVTRMQKLANIKINQ
jgi:isopentenyl diphosphate isomerase/L-lactate dehydrogenase-like FMN-dependent dehydrogenase